MCKVHYTIDAKQTMQECGSMRTRIKELRKEKKISQAELAEAVGVTRQTITSIEVEKYVASLQLAYKIASFFGLQIEEVFELEEE